MERPLRGQVAIASLQTPLLYMSVNWRTGPLEAGPPSRPRIRALPHASGRLRSWLSAPGPDGHWVGTAALLVRPDRRRRGGSTGGGKRLRAALGAGLGPGSHCTASPRPNGSVQLAPDPGRWTGHPCLTLPCKSMAASPVTPATRARESGPSCAPSTSPAFSSAGFAALRAGIGRGAGHRVRGPTTRAAAVRGWHFALRVRVVRELDGVARFVLPRRTWSGGARVPAVHGRPRMCVHVYFLGGVVPAFAPGGHAHWASSSESHPREIAGSGPAALGAAEIQGPFFSRLPLQLLPVLPRERECGRTISACPVGAGPGRLSDAGLPLPARPALGPGTRSTALRARRTRTAGSTARRLASRGLRCRRPSRPPLTAERGCPRPAPTPSLWALGLLHSLHALGLGSHGSLSSRGAVSSPA